jgi:predicted nucleic acid-binding Zn ribbon protein
MAEGKGPENLSDILSKLFAARGWGRKNERVRLEDAWSAASGELASQTRVVALRRGVLEIEVKGAVLLQECAQFRKRALLAALRQQMPGTTVTDLKFKAGAW